MEIALTDYCIDTVYNVWVEREKQDKKNNIFQYYLNK